MARTTRLPGNRPLLSSYWKRKGRKNVYGIDVLRVKDGEKLAFVFESVSSTRRQGVWLGTDRGITILKKRCGSLELWIDTAPRYVELTCHTSNGALVLYNIWEDEDVRGSQGETSGMLIEELPKGRRYRCHDFGLEPTFDSLGFRIEHVLGTQKKPPRRKTPVRKQR